MVKAHIVSVGDDEKGLEMNGGNDHTTCECTKGTRLMESGIKFPLNPCIVFL